MRGFGGRVYFYENNNPKPIKVNGQLIVYAFDDEGFDPRYGKPVKHFIFTEETFSKHHSESELGHSYSFFLPWDEIGGERQNVALIARFEPKDGQLIMSDASRMTLPGTVVAKNPPSAPTQAAPTQAAPIQAAPIQAAEQAVRQVSYEAPVVAPARPRMQTATIDLPPGTFATECPSPSLDQAVPRRLPATESVQPLPSVSRVSPSSVPPGMNPASANATVANGRYYDVLPAGSAGTAVPPAGDQPARVSRYPSTRANAPSRFYPNAQESNSSLQVAPQTGNIATPGQAEENATSGNWTTRVSYERLSWRDRATQRPLSHSGPQRCRAPRLTANQPRFDHAVSQPDPSVSPSPSQWSPPPAQAIPNAAYSPVAPQYQTPGGEPTVVYR